jgi:hypothetical protein
MQSGDVDDEHGSGRGVLRLHDGARICDILTPDDGAGNWRRALRRDEGQRPSGERRERCLAAYTEYNETRGRQADRLQSSRQR